METSNGKAEDDSNPKKDLNDTEASLSLSITPPIPDDNKKDNEHSDESISEHLTSNSTSVENDRSYQEIEISNRPSTVFFNLPSSDEERQHISQEQRPRSLETSFCSDTSVISLNYLDRISFRNMEMSDNVRSILDEILNDDQFVSGNEDSGSFTKSREESLNIFANIDLDDKSLTNFRNSQNDLMEKDFFSGNFAVPLARDAIDIDKRVKDFEELIAVKDSTIAALTSELDSFRELSNTNSGSMVSTTEYKQLQEECHSKLMEYNSAIIYKNDLIQQLSESLDQSVNERKELLKQVDIFKEEISQLQKQLQDTTRMVNDHKCVKETKEETDYTSAVQVIKEDDDEKTETSEPVLDLDLEFSTLESNLNPAQSNLLNDLKIKVNEFVRQSVMKNRNLYEEEISKLKENIVLEKEDYEMEINKLRDLLANIKCGSTEIMELRQELEARHSREVEELRTYFEKKCADLEKNYSEEVFSQQSRKMSGSTCSEAELNSDLLFSHPPGPHGDISYDLQPNITKKDLTNLKNELNSVLDKINNYNLDSISEEDFNALKSEMGKCNLNNLLKYDLAVIRNDLQNKYHAELEVLREDNENRVDLLNVEHEKKLRGLEEKYLEEVENLRGQIDELGRQNLCISSAVQEVTSSGEFEITEVIQSYERRLQQQVTLAKIDIISALESQIQRLASNEADDEEWPSELLQLRGRFTDKYENEIRQLKEEHRSEVEKLKDEHLRVLNGALERARRRSLRDNDSLSKGDLEILKERDNLKKQVSSLRNLLGELLKYFTQCEDELNNTLVDELLRQSFDKNLSQLEDELNLNDSSATNSSKTGDSLANVTRVHLAPNFSDLINLVESGSREEGDSRDISLDLKNELGICLDKLKQEANAILALTSNIAKQGSSVNVNVSPKGNSLEEKLSSMTRQLISEAQVKERLREELREASSIIETLEKQREELEGQLDGVIAKDNVLEEELARARSKIAELIENGHKEIVSEGYGEEGSMEMQERGDAMTILADLQEKARNMLAQSRASADPTLLHLIEELCRVGERIKEESQKERLDLLLQIDAADKKYRTTQKFLEEQAAEREMERDEAQKSINRLREQLKDRERDKASCERYNAEVNGVCCWENGCKKMQVEQLEQQLQEMTKLLAEESRRFKDLEAERNEAVSKIKELRDIICELELQTEAKTKEVEDCLEVIHKLECIVEQQDRSINELGQKDSLRDVSDIHQLRRHIESLESELQRTRVNSELAGSEGALAQIHVQLCDLEASLDKKTRELETLHSTETNCSSPSEDISARDLVQPNIPGTMDECEVPLQQLARLKEKLLRHSRAEEAAIKRIRDLEMHVFSLKNELEESNGEKDCMKKQIQEQLVLISDFQIRLDEQRLRADHIEKQTNTSLELKIYDLQNEIATLRDKFQIKEKTFAHQQILLSETQQRLKSLEEEISNNGKEDDELLVTMQKELEALRVQNAQMKLKMSNEAQIVPNLVENIISDKNVDIEKLREKLEETERLLESYTSLNLDRRELQSLSNLKSHGTSLEEVLGILDLSQRERIRKASRDESEPLELSHNYPYKRNVNETVFLGSASEPEISTIEKVGPHLFQPASGKTNSTEIYKSAEKRVHFEDTDVARLNNAVTALNEELEAKDKVIKEYEERLKLLNSLEEKIEKLQSSLEQTEKALVTATETFEREQHDSHEREKNLGVELAEKKLHLSEREKKIEMLEQDSRRKDQMCLDLADQKRDLEQALSKFKHESWKNLDTVIKEKNEEIDTLHSSLRNAERLNEEMVGVREDLQRKNMELTSLQKELNTLINNVKELSENNNELEAKMKETNEENVKLIKEKQNATIQVETLIAEMNNLKEKLGKKRRTVKELEDVVEDQRRSIGILENEVKKQRDVIVDRECEIEIANEDAKRYQNDIATLEDRIEQLEKGEHKKLIDRLEEDLKEKDAKIKELNKEMTHLQELLNEKDKIINQISEDSHKLHVNLVTIQAKLKETGNIIDLGNKLKEEQKRTAELVEEIHGLKARLMQYEATKRNNPMTTSVDEIADQVKRELDYSAQIDSNILSAVSDQSLSSISDNQEAEIFKKALAKEKSTRKQLLRVQDGLKRQVTDMEEKCTALQSLNEKLQSSLESERLLLRQTQAEDAKLIEQMRIQLDTVLDHEEVLERMVAEEKEAKRQLETELEAARQKTASSTSKTESTEYKALPSKETIELNQLRKDFTAVRDENDGLSKELNALKRAQSEMEVSYKYTKDMLGLEMGRAKLLEDKVQALLKNEKELRDVLLQRKVEVEEKLHEIENNKIVIDEMEQEKALLTKQNSELTQRLKTQMSTEPQMTRTSPVPDVLLDRIKELKNDLVDNKKFIDLIQKMSQEKRNLENELAALRGQKSANMPFADLVARSDFLFAKTLRLESTKKALIWQKRYLLDYLQGHQRHCLVEALPHLTVYRNKFKHQRLPRERFRSTVFVVISIVRMKYLVRRWHSGVRIAEKINSRHYRHQSAKQTETAFPAQFQVGQPVSSQFFSNNVGGRFGALGPKNFFHTNQTDSQENAAFGGFDEERVSPSPTVRDLPPWSGSSPPSKEGSDRRIRIGSHVLSREDMTPLKAPLLLAQFSERFDQIRETLGIALDSNAT
ncbi:centromere-associated protein E isoform X3 [Anoplophora glabripennis]|uniref:centromere-associated protein E isoform X3 n=1 Tax=Anoplophora glabripennis TaxID=217634 RepID=UPI000874A076|nr:centromere-associated protein E isoform X3 [Anoplophora glabripennis]